MRLKFPTMHIADSVINRILNAADGIPVVAPTTPTQAPALPDTATQGAMIDAQLAQPVADNIPPIDQTPDPGGALTGRPVLDQIVNPES